MLSRIDHLVYATPDLQAGVVEIEHLLGIQATPGGRHPGFGTRNALLSLGIRCYLEIIGPDPERHERRLPEVFGIDRLTRSRLVTWAASTGDLERLAEKEVTDGVRIGAMSAGSRQTPQGGLLSWRFTDPLTVVAGGVVPFFIDWGKTPHPSTMAAQGALLLDLRAEHPEPDGVQEILGSLDLGIPVSGGPAAALVARIQCPRGEVVIR